MVAKPPKASSKVKVAKPRKITFGVFLADQGDGSASARIFPTEEMARKFAEKRDQRLCDDTFTMSIYVDEQGNLVPPPDTKMIDGVLVDKYGDPTDYA